VELPAPAALSLNTFPNPFNPQISVRFELLTRSTATVAVYDLGGCLVRTLSDDVYTAGPHTIVWDGLDRRGRAIASGTYFVRLQTADGDATNKVSLIR
jgi:flagellar hook assembly protein FlgD